MKIQHFFLNEIRKKSEIYRGKLGSTKQNNLFRLDMKNRTLFIGKLIKIDRPSD